MKRLALAVLGLHLALLPCFADVIPSKYDDKSPAHRQAVKGRLEQLGMESANAEHRVKQLDTDELSYFAQNPERIQPAGALYWYEWLAGALVLTGVVAFWLLYPVRLS
jgi:hypothetical protein